MLLKIHHPDCDRCRHCRSDVARTGYVVEDSEGVRQFVCWNHLKELLTACLRPERITNNVA